MMELPENTEKGIEFVNLGRSVGKNGLNGKNYEKNGDYFNSEFRQMTCSVSFSSWTLPVNKPPSCNLVIAF